MVPFRSYASYLRERYGGSAYRVAIDAGFQCPHRERGAGRQGCSYCDAQAGFGPHRSPAAPVSVQIAAQLRRLARRKPAALLLYLQAYSGTNAAPQTLRSIYDGALANAPFRELIVATRPDCIDPERADLLASYRRPDFDVWVELGLQSAHEATLRALNRGHTVKDFSRACSLLRDRGVKVAVHLVFGLPGEGQREMNSSMAYVASFRPQGLKIHNLHICRDTVLADRFLRGELTAPGVASHLGYVAEALELLPEETVVMRLTTDTPPERLLAPRGFCDRGAFRRLLEARMRRDGLFQGRRFGAAAPEGQAHAADP